MPNMITTPQEYLKHRGNLERGVYRTPVAHRLATASAAIRRLDLDLMAAFCVRPSSGPSYRSDKREDLSGPVWAPVVPLIACGNGQRYSATVAQEQEEALTAAGWTFTVSTAWSGEDRCEVRTFHVARPVI